MAVIKKRPNFPDLNELYTGVTDDAFERMASSTRAISAQAKALGVNEQNLGISGNSYAYDSEEPSYGDDYEYASEEEQKLAQVLSQEDPEAEMRVGENAYFLYPDYGAILQINHHTGSVSVNTFEYEEDLEEAWDNCARVSRRRDF